MKSVAVVILSLLLTTATAAAQTSRTGGSATTSRVGDVTTLKGHGVNYLTGLGLVVGLAGTGDGDDYLPAMQPLAKSLSGFFADPVASMEELKDTKNVAVVLLEATLPENGTREGDRIDVRVSAFGAAKSLEGGRLLPVPLLYPDTRVDEIFALAAGPVTLPNSEVLTGGVVENGAVMQVDNFKEVVAWGRDLPFSSTWVQQDASYLTLVIQDSHASWTLAREIAQAVDSELALAADLDHVALAVDAKNVLVLVPEDRMVDLADWISQIEQAPLLLIEASGATVTVNRTTGTIIASASATMSPVIVSHRGLTITVASQEDENGLFAPDGSVQNFVALDPGGTSNPQARELLEALNRLDVPIEDRIDILTQIHSMGALHARLVIRD